MTPVEIVSAYRDAVDAMDMEKLRELLATDYSFQGPMKTFEGADAFVEFMSTGPFKASQETLQMVAGDDAVAHVFLFRMTAPTEAEIRMCEIFDVRDGRIASSKLFFDTAKFPMQMGGG